MLAQNQNLAFEFNHFGQTALHLAAMRDNYLVILELLNHRALVHHVDILGRNSLFFASKHNFLMSVKALLAG